MTRRQIPLQLIVAAACLAVALIFVILRPVAEGHRYDLTIKLCLPIFLFSCLLYLWPGYAFKKITLAILILAGLSVGSGSLATLDPDSEIVNVYRTVFQTMDRGENPYTSGTVYHRDADGKAVYGNFNYPPLEIYPYYLVWKITGCWNSVVLVITIMFINFLACLVLLTVFREVPVSFILPYLVFILLIEIKTNPSMTLLLSCLIILAVKKFTPDWNLKKRLITAGLFGLGLLTKFFVVPLAGVYYWKRIVREKEFLSRPWQFMGEIALMIAVVFLVVAPFGAWPVFKSTIIFNLALEERAVLTTFYPNVLSGLATWLGLKSLYPWLAVGLLAAAVIFSVRLKIFEAMFWTGAVFLWVASTPEPQYLPVAAALFLAAWFETYSLGDLKQGGINNRRIL